jgi:predicted O-linked N-acetylglucosamine transferase (SPINDLY family)
VAPGRVTIHERMGQEDFLALNEAAALGDRGVVLDGIGWSGCNTTFEAVAIGLPVVTWPGALMRMRHSAAILTQMGVTETIAGSADDTVEIAVRLGRDPAWRARLAAEVRERSRLAFDDETPIRALEAFLDRVTRGADMPETPPADPGGPGRP